MGDLAKAGVSLEGFRKELKSLVDKSDIGLVSLIKAAILDKKIEEVFNFDEESLERSVEEVFGSIVRLNSFIDQFNFAQDSAARQKLDKILEDIDDTLEEGFEQTADYLKSAEDAFSKGDFLDQVKVFYEVIKIVSNIKGFFKKAIDNGIDPTIAKLNEYKKEI